MPGIQSRNIAGVTVKEKQLRPNPDSLRCQDIDRGACLKTATEEE